MKKPKTHKCCCTECEVYFTLIIDKSYSDKNSLPEICPFCGETIKLDSGPLLKNFDDYDEFDDDKYYDDYEDDIDDDQE